MINKIELKEKLYTLYLIAFTLLFCVHTFFQIQKAIYINMYSLNDKISGDQFFYLQRFSKLSLYFEYAITAVFILALAISIISYKAEISSFIRLNYIIVMVLLLLSFGTAFLYNASFGNLTQPLVFPFTILTIVAIVRMISVKRINISHRN